MMYRKMLMKMLVQMKMMMKFSFVRSKFGSFWVFFSSFWVVWVKFFAVFRLNLQKSQILQFSKVQNFGCLGQNEETLSKICRNFAVFGLNLLKSQIFYQIFDYLRSKFRLFRSKFAILGQI